MNRVEFIAKLKELLNDIPDSEREEAVSFYDNYFDEAGTENEPQVIEDLESPDKVAAIIKAGLSDKPDENGEYSERGYQNHKFVDREEIARRTETKNNSGTAKGQEDSAGKIVLIVVLCIFAAPIVLPVAIAIISTLFALVVSLVAIIAALCVAGVCVLVAGIALIVAGLIKLFVSPFAALCLLGVGFIATGFSIMGILLLIMAGSVVIPACIRGIVHLCQMPFKKKEVAE